MAADEYKQLREHDSADDVLEDGVGRYVNAACFGGDADDSWVDLSAVADNAEDFAREALAMLDASKARSSLRVMEENLHAGERASMNERIVWMVSNTPDF